MIKCAWNLWIWLGNRCFAYKSLCTACIHLGNVNVAHKWTLTFQYCSTLLEHYLVNSTNKQSILRKMQFNVKNISITVQFQVACSLQQWFATAWRKVLFSQYRSVMMARAVYYSQKQKTGYPYPEWMTGMSVPWKLVIKTGCKSIWRIRIKLLERKAEHNCWTAQLLQPSLIQFKLPLSSSDSSLPPPLQLFYQLHYCRPWIPVPVLCGQEQECISCI